MTWWEILIIIGAAAFVVAVTVASIIRKKRGKTGCGCGCENCTGCSRAPSSEGENKK